MTKSAFIEEPLSWR